MVPPAENGAFFVTTNLLVTSNQTWGRCPEVGFASLTPKQSFSPSKVSSPDQDGEEVAAARCNQLDSTQCSPGKSPPKGAGTELP